VHNFLLNAFKQLSAERQVVIWHQLLETPIFIEFLVGVKKYIEQQYYNIPEPEDFEQHTMAQHITAKRQLKSAAAVIDDLLGIDGYMRNKSDNLN